MSTITGTQTHTPAVIEGASFGGTARTIVHESLGGAPVVTLRAGAPRRGTVLAAFADEVSARALEADLMNARTFILTRDDLASGPVEFVPQGDIRVDLNTAVYVWTVAFDWVRVS